MIANVFAMTLTGLPDVPNWRGGATADVDCMVYVSTNVITRHEKKREIQDAEIQGRGEREGGRGKRERVGVRPSHMDVFYSG